MAMSEAHKAALAEGRRKRAVQDAENGALRAAEFCEWSRAHSRAWSRWLQECGKARCKCAHCVVYRGVTSAIPFNDACKDSDFDAAKEMGLI